MAKKTKAGTVQRPTCLIHEEDGELVSLCPEYDIASQGAIVEEARGNLVEAIELFMQTASLSEISHRGRAI